MTTDSSLYAVGLFVLLQVSVLWNFLSLGSFFTAHALWGIDGEDALCVWAAALAFKDGSA